ncbi:leucine-rich repeat domain-containing protein [Runella salmonicolor]|uniref:Leucine-rich repeat domain-containing protein n=1 Tax=Runella salmonicolor TaxID=2950278 RepID=A0ABT1FS67_9BACT|nr:leucine-rich repeat domain-containing protein [Runella salmonicolor]MCP1384606.1 leucine-rich repeat domain-containing protein [Runella salmonicolor]
MKTFFFSLVFLVLQIAQAQIKIMTFEEAQQQTLNVKVLDSLYAVPQKFFEGNPALYTKDQRAFVMRINTLSRQIATKKDNVRIWGRFYVSKDGHFDYFLYQMEGKISTESQSRLLDSLKNYLSAYKFPVKITVAHSFHQIIQMGVIRTVIKGKNTIRTLEEAIATTRPDTVKVLALNQLELDAIPEVIYRFTEMKELNLSGNELKRANIDLARLPKLRHIWLNNNQLTDSSLLISPNKTLKILNLQGNRFADIPEAVHRCKKLNSLWLGYNKLTQLNEESFRGLRYLLDLNLYSCELTTLPKNIVKLRRLEVLDLYYNQLSILPSSLGRMKKLQQLALSNNDLQTLPSLHRLKRLQTLYIHHNKLTALPSSIRKLKRLRILDINNNQFSTLPSQIGKLRKVEDLDISNNNLSEVPKELLQLPRLQKLYLRANPFSRDAVLLSRSKPIIESLENKKTDVSY